MLRLSKSRSYLVPVVVRTLDVLELLQSSETPLRTNQIADALRLPRTTTYRILRTLYYRGYVTQDLDGGYLPENLTSWKTISRSIQEERGSDQGTPIHAASQHGQLHEILSLLMDQLNHVRAELRTTATKSA